MFVSFLGLVLSLDTKELKAQSLPTMNMAITDQQKQMAALKRKNASLTLEMNQREDILGLEADFEAILDDK